MASFAAVIRKGVVVVPVKSMVADGYQGVTNLKKRCPALIWSKMSAADFLKAG
jgi:hypothetical protein